MTRYWNKKYDFAVEADRIAPGAYHEGFPIAPEFSKLFADFPEPYWLVKYENTNLLLSDELFPRFFIREPAIA